MKTSDLSRVLIAVSLLCVTLSALQGCQKNSAGELPASSVDIKTAVADNPPTPKDADKKEGEVTLTPAQIDKIGLQTTEVKAVEFGDEATGFGSVIAHDSIAQAMAELISAQAVEKQSRAALTRAQRLSGTAGALSADTEEASTRQAEVDAAALTLAKQRLSATFGLKPPWGDGGNLALLHGLADGRPKLLRVTFPLGTLTEVPKILRAAPIGAAAAKRWKMTTIWAAPADANLPGRSFFAILSDADAGEGERALVWAPVGPSTSGVVIPQSAVVISDGRYWCYLQEQPGTVVRTEIDTRRSFEDGYFVSDGVKVGDKVVIKGAAQLLAQESNSGGDAD